MAITLDLGAVALVAASLSYIGFGVPSGYAEWGRMVSDGQGWFLAKVPFNGAYHTPWWVVSFPALMILLFTMGFSLLGDGLRDILDRGQGGEKMSSETIIEIEDLYVNLHQIRVVYALDGVNRR